MIKTLFNYFGYVSKSEAGRANYLAKRRAYYAERRIQELTQEAEFYRQQYEAADVTAKSYRRLWGETRNALNALREKAT